MTNHIPDIFDLNDWILETRPEIFRATCYLHASIQYKTWLKVWRDAREPNVSLVWTA